MLTLTKELVWLATEGATEEAIEEAPAVHQSAKTALDVGHTTGGHIPGVGGFQTTGLEHQSAETVLDVGHHTPGAGGFLTPGQEPSMGGAESENGFEQQRTKISFEQ